MRNDALHRGDDFVLDTRDVPVPVRHNRGNL
jgi:UDP-N-acetylmuramoylalanine--D-glutamate ligase